MPRSKPATNALRRDLTCLYDDFTAFNESCAFFCDACTALLTTEDSLDPVTVHGLGRNALQLKHQSEHLRKRLKHIQRRANAQNRADK